MATRIKCTGRDFTGIINPYTGVPVVTEMLVLPSGECLFGAPDTYSPSAWVQDAREAYRLWSRDMGVDGARKGQKITCAFTGEGLSIETDPQLGTRYAGGFDPRVFRPRHEYLNGITMLRGERTRPEYLPLGRVTPPPPEHVIPLEHATEMLPGAEEAAASAMAAAHFEPEKKTVVNMSVKRKGDK